MEALNEISMLVKEYISPETLWLVPCLYALGIIIKKSIRIDDTLIPTILWLNSDKELNHLSTVS